MSEVNWTAVMAMVWQGCWHGRPFSVPEPTIPTMLPVAVLTSDRLKTPQADSNIFQAFVLSNNFNCLLL